MSNHADRPRKMEIELGLEVIAAISPPGFCWEQIDIAAVCGCSPQAIQHIEYGALAKLRKRAKQMIEED